MATQVIMPKLGMAMSNGVVVKWLKANGAEVKKGEPVVVVMSKKITYQVESPDDGILRHVARPKDTCDIGQAIGFVTAPGEPVPEVERAAPPATAPGAVPAPAPVPAAPERAVPSSPAARRLARELGVDIARVPAGGSRITEEDVRRYHEQQSRVPASPLARRMAEEEGLDLSHIRGTGPGGRVTEEDVLGVLAGALASAAPRPSRIPFLGMRQSIAGQMVHSLQTLAELTITARADVTELKATREALAARWKRPVSYTDLLVKAVTMVLREHPLLGARLEGDEIVMPAGIDVGVAVALEEGLIVPVVRDADWLTLPEIGDRIKDLAERARANALGVDEVTGAVFTVTNLGMYGVDAFTPIINPPEVAILGVGCIAEELALLGGQVAARSRMVLSLTIDHRVVDGAPGAAFLQTLVQLLEHPALIFAGGPAPQVGSGAGGEG